MDDIPEAGEFKAEYERLMSPLRKEPLIVDMKDLFTRHATAFLRRVLGEIIEKEGFNVKPEPNKYLSIHVVREYIDRYTEKPKICKCCGQEIKEEQNV